MTETTKRWIRAIALTIAVLLVMRFGFHESWTLSLAAPALLFVGSAIAITRTSRDAEADVDEPDPSNEI